MSLREAVSAAVTLVVVTSVAWITGIELWLLTGLWLFMALWSVRTGVHLFRATRRRALLLASGCFAAGAACGAAMFVLWDRERLALPLAVAAAALLCVSLVIGVADWRRSVG